MAALSVLDLGTHVCHLYRGEDDLKDVTLPFLSDGLRNGECCVYVADGSAVDAWYDELQGQGVDVALARETGALTITSSDAWRAMCQSGSVGMAREVLGLVDQKLGAFPSIRIAGNVGWSEEPAVSAEMLCHWEATANVVFEGLPARVICQYDIESYQPAFIHAALRTHPIVLYKGRRVRSPYYEAANILAKEPKLNGSSNDPEVVANMLAKLA
jgi:MEDS: MEthanogen/methylotroph, DcmR Sensory domain